MEHHLEAEARFGNLVESSCKPELRVKLWGGAALSNQVSSGFCLLLDRAAVSRSAVWKVRGGEKGTDRVWAWSTSISFLGDWTTCRPQEALYGWCQEKALLKQSNQEESRLCL